MAKSTKLESNIFYTILMMLVRVFKGFIWIVKDLIYLVEIKGREDRAVSKILLIRLDAIGDFILWSDSAREIRESYPVENYKITLLGNQLWADFAEHLPWFDSVWPLDKVQFLESRIYRTSILNKIREAGFDIVIHTTFSREFILGDYIVWLSGAKIRIGSYGDHSNIKYWHKKIGDRWYTDLISVALEPKMELLRNAEFMRGLGSTGFSARLPELPNGYSSPYRTGEQEYYVLFPGAGWTGRQWPLERFSQVAEKMYNLTSLTGIVCGSSSERELGESLIRSTAAPLENLAGETTLLDLVSIIGDSRIVIANETCAIHIAAAVSVPSVCILGGGHYGRFVPYQLEVDPRGRPLPFAVTRSMDCFGCNWNCIYQIAENQPVPCIACITVDSVWGAILGLLRKTTS